MNKIDEALILENALADLRAEGFDVLIQPSREALPAFLKDYVPDAIATRSDRKIVVEVVRPGASTDRRLADLRHLLTRQKDWELQVIWASQTSAPREIEPVSRTMIERSLKHITALVSDNNVLPGLLMAWATFEAIARTLIPDEFARPQTPGRLVSVLATSGHLTPTEADHLRKLVDVRNKLIHGGLDQRVARTDVNKFIDILRELVAQALSNDNTRRNKTSTGK